MRVASGGLQATAETGSSIAHVLRGHKVAHRECSWVQRTAGQGEGQHPHHPHARQTRSGQAGPSYWPQNNADAGKKRRRAEEDPTPTVPEQEPLGKRRQGRPESRESLAQKVRHRTRGGQQDEEALDVDPPATVHRTKGKTSGAQRRGKPGLPLETRAPPRRPAPTPPPQGRPPAPARRALTKVEDVPGQAHLKGERRPRPADSQATGNQQDLGDRGRGRRHRGTLLNKLGSQLRFELPENQNVTYGTW